MEIVCLTFNPNSTILATGSMDHTAKVCWLLLCGVAHSSARSCGVSSALAQLAVPRSAMLWPIGQCAVKPCLCPPPAVLQLWDVEKDTELLSLMGHSAEIVSVCFNNGGDLVATGSFDHDSRLWDVRTGQCVHVLTGHRGEVSSTVFNYSGREAMLSRLSC